MKDLPHAVREAPFSFIENLIMNALFMLLLRGRRSHVIRGNQLFELLLNHSTPKRTKYEYGIWGICLASKTVGLHVYNGFLGWAPTSISMTYIGLVARFDPQDHAGIREFSGTQQQRKKSYLLGVV